MANKPRSVISANVKLALRWRSRLSEKTRVLRARRGSPEKKSVSPRYSSVSTKHSSPRGLGFIVVHSRDTVGGLQPLPARCPRGPVRRGHRGICLWTHRVRLDATSRDQGAMRSFHYLRSTSCRHPCLQRLGRERRPDANVVVTGRLSKGLGSRSGDCC